MSLRACVRFCALTTMFFSMTSFADPCLQLNTLVNLLKNQEVSQALGHRLIQNLNVRDGAFSRGTSNTYVHFKLANGQTAPTSVYHQVVNWEHIATLEGADDVLEVPPAREDKHGIKGFSNAFDLRNFVSGLKVDNLLDVLSWNEVKKAVGTNAIQSIRVQTKVDRTPSRLDRTQYIIDMKLADSQTWKAAGNLKVTWNLVQTSEGVDDQVKVERTGPDITTAPLTARQDQTGVR